MSERVAFFDMGDGYDPNKAGKAKSTNLKVGCESCGLYKACKSPKIEHIGEGKKKILFITEYPGKTEDRHNTVLSNAAFDLLQGTLSEIDLDLEKDCWVVHAVRCSPKDYKAPDNRYAQLCKTNLMRTINELNPEVIIPLGTLSVYALIADRITGRLSGTKYHQFFGERIPDQELGKYICPTYSAEWILKKKTRSRKGEVIDPVYLKHFKKSIKKAVRLAGTPFYTHNLETDVLTTTDPEEAAQWIEDITAKAPAASFDYETPSLKPHMEEYGVKIASISDGLFGYAFPFFEDHPRFRRAWYRFTRSNKIGKIAHKMDFENGWTAHGGTGKYCRNWEWDTCLAAHFINSFKPTGLKFHTYVKLGILGYDDSVDKYLKPSPKQSKLMGGNAPNRIDRADLKKALIYCAQDSLFTMHLYFLQRTRIKNMGSRFLKGYRDFLEGAEALSQIQNEGMLCDMKYLKKSSRILTHKIEHALLDLKEFDEWKAWPGKEEFSPNSNAQLEKLLYKVLKNKKPREGEKLTDEKQLKRIGTPFCERVIDYRKVMKMKNTYLGQFEREQVDGVIRPFFNLHIPVTFRSSSDSPNFQNMPARDPQALKFIMQCIVPRSGNKLIEWDYKGVEVTVSCCYHKDPTMISYLVDGGDMHGDTAADVLLKTPNQVSKMERQFIGKGGFVFPSFYGSGVSSMAPAIWELVTENPLFADTYHHLKSQGIRTYKDFYAHMEDVYDIFWNERFPVYSEWKKKTWRDYQRKGYVDLKTGFRYYGPAEFTQVTNTQIQGSAFHVLLWSAKKIYPIIRDNFENSFIIGQIHDALVGDINGREEPEIDSIVKLWGTEKVREYWPWIELPLFLEKESTDTDMPWNTMKERGFI